MRATRILAALAFAMTQVNAASIVRVPDVAVFDASETLVAVALNGSGEGGSSLTVYEATVGTALATVAFPDRTNGIFFCSSKSLMAWTEAGVVRVDPRTGATEEVMPLSRGERVAVAPRCDSVAIYGPDRKEVTVFFFGSRRKFSFEAPAGARAVCYSGDETSLVVLGTSGSLHETEMQKKRRRFALPAPASGEALGISCFGKHGLAIGGLEVELRPIAGAEGGSRIPLACSIEYHGCAVSADGRTVATVSDESGKRLKAIRFHSTSRMKGVATAGLAQEPAAIALSPSGASALVTFAQGPPLLVSRANGATLKLAAPGARIGE